MTQITQFLESHFTILDSHQILQMLKLNIQNTQTFNLKHYKVTAITTHPAQILVQNKKLTQLLFPFFFLFLCIRFFSIFFRFACFFFNK